MSALARYFQRPKGRAERRGYPIHAYTGPNGGGKSACMVWDTIPSLEAGRKVLSTVRLLDYENPRPCDDPACPHPEHAGVMMPVRGGGEGDGAEVHELFRAMPSPAPVTHMAAHPLYVPFTSWDQLMEAERCDVLMDEVTGVASSRESMGLPAAVANKMVQLRRADVVVRWSSPAYMRADKILRECTQAVTYCEGFFSKSVEDEEGARSWSRRRLFKWKTFDAMAFEDFTSGKREAMDADVVAWHWGPGALAFKAYDTMDAVNTIGTVSESGTCYRCGGRRARPSCSCPDARPAAPVGEGGRPEAEPSTGGVTGKRARRAE